MIQLVSAEGPGWSPGRGGLKKKKKKNFSAAKVLLRGKFIVSKACGRKEEGIKSTTEASILMS